MCVRIALSGEEERWGWGPGLDVDGHGLRLQGVRRLDLASPWIAVRLYGLHWALPMDDCIRALCPSARSPPSLNTRRIPSQHLGRNLPRPKVQGPPHRNTANPSYAALGLLASIPLPSAPSSSRSHRAKLPFLPGQEELTEEEMLKSAVVGYGRIVRDEDGNVIDIILPEEEEGAGQTAQAQEAQEEEETGVRVVEAKTDVVRCKSIFFLSSITKKAGSEWRQGLSSRRAIRQGRDWGLIAICQ